MSTPWASERRRHRPFLDERAQARRARCFVVVSGLCALGVLGVSRRAGAVYADEEGYLTLNGSLRSMTVAVDSPDWGAPGSSGGADGLNASSLRLTADGSPAEWFSYEIHVVQDLLLTTGGGSMVEGFDFAAGGTTRYRLVEAGRTWVDDGDVEARAWVDRARVEYRLPGFDVALGRQAVTFGKAQFWSPLDVFLPFDARQFDREYKRGVDAVRVDVPIGFVSGLNLVVTPGRVDQSPVYRRSWYGSAALVRGYTNVADWDLSLQAGKIYGGYQMGGGVAGALGPVELRGEMAYFRQLDDDREPTPLPHHWMGVAGVGRRFDCSLNLQAEYLYNGAGDDGALEVALARVAAGRSLQMSEHVAGIYVGYELTALLTGSTSLLGSLSDGSGVVQPGLSYSVSDESDIVAGALIAFGKRPRWSSEGLELQSEFGTYPDFYYAQYRFYF